MTKPEQHLPAPIVGSLQHSSVPSLLSQVRPAWKAKNLIRRVERLLEVDASSACQRLFNAALHDLREKIVVAGIDIARDAAAQADLPPVRSPEDVENYSTQRIIDLAYRMGLLSRPEWRRLSRCYEIRRDLEHEDDEYEAGLEDCVYIFKTCVEVVLSKDPVQLLRVSDVKNLVEHAAPVVPSETLLEDFGSAPAPRQEEITKFLISIALDPEQPDLVQQNAFAVLSRLTPSMQNSVQLALADFFQSKIGRERLDRRTMRVAHAAGAAPFLRQAQRSDFFDAQYAKMNKVGWRWTSHKSHGELLRSFHEIGGLNHAPPAQRKKILLWLVRTYVGEPGGRTSWGNIRHVFYSNSAAPLIKRIIRRSKDLVREELPSLREHKTLKKRLDKNAHLARRFEDLLDLLDETTLAD